MKSYICIVQCTHIICLSVTMDPIFAVCLCVVFSFLFCFYSFFMWKTCLKVIAFSFLSLSAAKMLPKDRDKQRERERKRGREKTKQKLQISPLHDEAALSGCCLCKNETYRVHYLLCFLYGPNKNKNKVKDFAYLFNKERPCICCFYYCYLYFYFFIINNKSAEFAVLHNCIYFSVTLLFTFARCVCGQKEQERVRERGKWEPKECVINSIEIMIYAIIRLDFLGSEDCIFLTK